MTWFSSLFEYVNHSDSLTSKLLFYSNTFSQNFEAVWRRKQQKEKRYSIFSGNFKKLVLFTFKTKPQDSHEWSNLCNTSRKVLKPTAKKSKKWRGLNAHKWNHHKRSLCLKTRLMARICFFGVTGLLAVFNLCEGSHVPTNENKKHCVSSSRFPKTKQKLLRKSFTPWLGIVSEFDTLTRWSNIELQLKSKFCVRLDKTWYDSNFAFIHFAKFAHSPRASRIVKVSLFATRLVFSSSFTNKIFFWLKSWQTEEKGSAF